jgi:hypothetical protein
MNEQRQFVPEVCIAGCMAPLKFVGGKATCEYCGLTYSKIAYEPTKEQPNPPRRAKLNDSRSWSTLVCTTSGYGPSQCLYVGDTNSAHLGIGGR